jgi:hypothetical protein
MVVERTPRPVLVTGKEGQIEAPYTLLYTGTASAERALSLATRLTRLNGAALQLWQLGTADETATIRGQLASTLREENVRAHFTQFTTINDLLRSLTAARPGTLILPIEQIAWLPKLSGPVIVVP